MIIDLIDNRFSISSAVSYGVFIKEQPFLNFLCEVMLHSPTGKWLRSNRRNVGRLELKDVINFFDPDQNGEYYDGERKFLLEHCRSKYCTYLIRWTNSFILNYCRSFCLFRGGWSKYKIQNC